MADNGAKQHIDAPTGVETVGHEWDGIEELNNPLPRWWLLSFYACILYAIGYVIVYPAIPMLSKGTEGLWGWTSRGELASETRAAESARAGTLSAIAATPIAQIVTDPKLFADAKAGGKAAFRVNCVQCHGSEAAGGAGYPNLNDDDWLWGGNLDEIHQTLLHGIRQPGDTQTRQVQNMPRFGRDGLLTAAQIGDVASHVRAIGRQGSRRASGRARGRAVRFQLRGLPRAGRQRQPPVRRAEPDRRGLALWRQPCADRRQHCGRSGRCHACLAEQA